MRHKVTMNDVAKAAGVTQSTVSHVINKSASVSDGVYNRVQEAIKELGYQPNIMAKSLKTKKTNVIGLIVPDICIPFFAEIAKEVEANIQKAGYILMLCNTFYSPELENKFVSTLIQYNVAGLIVSYGVSDPNIYHTIIENEISVVTLDDKVDLVNIQIPSIEVDNFSGSDLAVSHLKEIGAKKIYYASEPLSNKALRNRFEGYKSAMLQYGYDFDDSMCFIESNQSDKVNMGYNIGAKIILNKEIDAVFASNDQLACGIIKRFLEYGISIPEEIAIVGYDNVVWSKFISPALTTIAQPNVTMAQLGSRNLLTLIKGGTLPDDEQEIILQPSLIIRESTLRVYR
ncbi:MAG: LacI family DNA-binding transcriptional regulator [Christensenella sp.]|nr:LacI family DNA-binding transcriptional regulator [Christensenella sp.]